MLAFDTETYPIAPGVPAPQLVVLSHCPVDPERCAGALVAAHDAAAWVREQLARGETLVGHHVAFDVLVLVRQCPELLEPLLAAYDQGRVRDTMIAEQLLDIAQGRFRFAFDVDPDTGETTTRPVEYGLGPIAQRRCGIALDKSADSWRTRYHELANTPLDAWPADAQGYALDDARATALVRVSQQRDIERLGGLPDEPAQCRAALALHVLGARGLVVDQHAVAALDAQLRADYERGKAAIEPLGVYRPDGTRDMSRLRTLVVEAYDRAGRRVPLTKHGAVSTSRDTLLSSGDAALAQLAELGKLAKLLTAFVPGLRAGARAPLTCRYNVLVESGRTSASGVIVDGVRGPQLQQLPRVGGVRECFVPRPGYVFASCDYDTLELRSLAQVCLWVVGYSELAIALRAGRDLHLDFAAQLLGVPYDEALARLRAGDKAVKLARQQAKPANFGFPGGLGPEKFRAYARQTYGVEFTLAEATALRDAWRARWPEVRELQNRIAATIDPVTDTCDVLQLRSGRLRAGCTYTEACNTVFQGLAADGAKRALWGVLRDGRAAGIRPVAFLHDEILAEVPEATAHESATVLGEIMVREMAAVIPDVPITCSPALMRRWYKDAATVRDSSGRLICGEPPTTPLTQHTA